MISVKPADQPTKCPDVMLQLIEPYLFIPFSPILTIFQGHSNIKQFWTRMKNVSLCKDHC